MVDIKDLRKRLVHAHDSQYPSVQMVVAQFGYRLFPNDPWWATQYGYAMSVIGRDAEAERALLAAHPHRDKNRERVEWLLGEVYQHQGRFDEAEKWYRLATTTAPSSTAPWVMLGGSLASRQRFRDACEVLEQGLHATGDVDEVYYNLGLNRRTLGDLEEAKKCFEAALAITPDYTLAQTALQGITEAIQITNEFATQIEQALVKHP